MKSVGILLALAMSSLAQGKTVRLVSQSVHMRFQSKFSTPDQHYIWKIGCDSDPSSGRTNERSCFIAKTMLNCGGDHKSDQIIPEGTVSTFQVSQGLGDELQTLKIKSWSESELRVGFHDGIQYMMDCEIKLKSIERLFYLNEHHIRQAVVDVVCTSTGGGKYFMDDDDLDLAKTCQGIVVPGKRSAQSLKVRDSR